MREKEFFAAIGLIRQRRKNIFTEEIRRTQKYNALCSNSSKCTGEIERKLLIAIKQLDQHLFYNNHELLLQVREEEHRLFLREANRLVNKIEELVRTIHWDEELK